jgi:hypothetical protein
LTLRQSSATPTALHLGFVSFVPSFIVPFSRSNQNGISLVKGGLDDDDEAMFMIVRAEFEQNKHRRGASSGSMNGLTGRMGMLRSCATQKVSKNDTT